MAEPGNIAKTQMRFVDVCQVRRVRIRSPQLFGLLINVRCILFLFAFSLMDTGPVAPKRARIARKTSAQALGATGGSSALAAGNVTALMSSAVLPSEYLQNATLRPEAAE